MKKSIGLIFEFLFITALVACNSSSANSEAPTVVQPTNTKLVLPTSTAPIVPTVNPLTPTAIAQFFHTLEAITPTPEATSIPSYEECSQWNELTADQNWALCDPAADPITLINRSNQIWQFSYKTHYGTEVLNPCTQLLYSTNDGKYLYFSLDADCILTEPGFVPSIGVFRMNLMNGDVNEILKASYDFNSYSGHYHTESISPTGRRMAYMINQDQPLKLHLLDLQTGAEQSFSIEDKYVFGGQYTWSADGTKLVFMLESESNDDHFISMVFFDLLKDNSMVTFIKDKGFNWIGSMIEITGDGVKVSPMKGDGDPLFYNIKTGILSQVNK